MEENLDLNSFRSQWKEEITKNQKKEEPISAEESSKESLATQLFKQAIELERTGKVFDAIRIYKRALQIDPNIEHKLYQASNNNNNNQNDVTKSKSHRISKNVPATSLKKPDDGDNNSYDDIDNLVESFSRDLAFENIGLCQKADVSRIEKHISCLPFEVFLHILKFVISNDLDMKSLEMFGETCKGFYLLSRENELWRKACEKVWKNNLSESLSVSWRDTFLNRFRVLFDGCYISKITYQRLGENSFQDQFYRPFQIITYFRLVRFFPNGEIFSMTSADDLQSSVNKFRNKQYAMQSRDILKGSYHYQDNHVLIVIKKLQSNQASNVTRYKRRNIEKEDDRMLTFFLELEIAGSSKRKFHKLLWKNYSVSQLKDGHELATDYDLSSSSKYPPFFFSHVKSYHSQSYDCLQ